MSSREDAFPAPRAFLTEQVKADQSFARLFAASPAPFLVLAPDAPRFTITEVNDAYLSATMTDREDIVGQGVFEAFPDNPDDPAVEGVSTLRASLERVLATRKPDTLPGLKYDVARPDGTFEERWWSPVNSPVLDEDGEVEAIIHNANDVTAQHRAEAALHESVEQQAFMLELSDALRPLDTTIDIAAEAAARLGKWLSLNRVFYGEIAGTKMTVECNYTDGVESLVGEHDLAALGDFLLRYRADTIIVSEDTQADTRYGKDARAGLLNNQVLAFCDIGLFDTGDCVSLMAAQCATTRQWTAVEQGIVREVGGRVKMAIERARAEAALRESEARFRLMADAVPQIVWITDNKGRVEFFNKQWSNYTGADLEATTATEVAANHVHPDDAAATVAAFDEARRTGTTYMVEHRIRSATGEHRWFLVRGEPYRDTDTGSISRWFGASVDIHDRKLAEDALRALNADLERKVTERAMARGRTWQLSPEIMGVLNVDGYFEQSNAAWASVLGWSEEEVARTVFFDFIHPDDLPNTHAAWDAAIERGEPALRFVNRYRTKNGGWRWLSWVAVPEDGKVYCSARDVTGDKEREEALAERTAERDRMWRTSPDLLLVVGFDGVFRRVNPAWTTILGYAEHELVGTRVDRLVHPDDVELTEKALARATAGPLPVVENRYRHKDGSYRWISWITAPPEGGMIYATGRHVSAEKERQAELVQAQEALRQSQKMEAMGQLTGGVAHDFNNLLTPIVGSLDLLQRRGVGSEREQRLIAGAMQSADRAKTLVQRLLAFARRQPLQPTPVDVGRLVEGMADLLSRTTGPQVRVAFDVAEDLPPAKADPNQLEMALLNLGVNARDAMPEGGTLRISATRESVREPHGDLKRGHYVRLSVADTGIGMDEATLARATEPFFSTKGVGKGTGLGLSMVHGLAAQLGGALSIQSRRGVGTNVELWLPVSAIAIDLLDQAKAAAPLGTACGLALLVDDEEIVRASTADMLEGLGYQVQEAESAEAALALLSGGLLPDLLITDHLMPGMTGVELAWAARERLPKLPVLIISGYAEAEGVAPNLPRLTKPFRSTELATCLASLSLEQRKALD